MSRSIHIGSRKAPGDSDTRIDVPAPYFLLGGQRSSMAFWSIPRIREIGIVRLAELGEGDPVYFTGWDEMQLRGKELSLLQEHISTISFDLQTKLEWLCHLILCYYLLIETASRDSSPVFGIG
jgi:hypothetical protein